MRAMVWQKRSWQWLAAALVFSLVVVWYMVQNLGQLHRSIEIIQRTPVSGYLFAAPLLLLTFVLAAFSYGFLAFHPLKFLELFTVELAAAAVNRVVPSGLGGAGLHGLYLHNRRHTVAEATAVVSTNNLLGALVHVSILGAVLAPVSSRHFHFRLGIEQRWFLLGCGAICMMLFALWIFRRVVYRFVRNVLASLRTYEQQPHRLVYAAFSLLALTLTNLVILHLVASSYGVWLDAPTLLVIYSVGVLMGAVVPTPGGLAGVEAGLTGGFMAFGVESTNAIALALTFRLLTYWLPIIPGLIALVVARAHLLL